MVPCPTSLKIVTCPPKRQQKRPDGYYNIERMLNRVLSGSRCRLRCIWSGSAQCFSCFAKVEIRVWIISAVLALLWVWAAVIYCFMFFTAISRSGWVIGSVLLAGGLWMAWIGSVKNGIRFQVRGDLRSLVGWLLNSTQPGSRAHKSKNPRFEHGAYNETVDKRRSVRTNRRKSARNMPHVSVDMALETLYLSPGHLAIPAGAR